MAREEEEGFEFAGREECGADCGKKKEGEEGGVGGDEGDRVIGVLD